MVHQDQQVLEVIRAFLVRRVRMVNLEHRDNAAMLAHLAHRGLLVKQEPLGLQVSLDHRARTDSQDLKVPRVHLAHPDHPDHGAIQDRKALRGKRVNQAHKDHRAIQVALDHQDNQDHRVLRGIKDKLEIRDRLVLPVNRASEGAMVPLEHLEVPEPAVTKVRLD